MSSSSHHQNGLLKFRLCVGGLHQTAEKTPVWFLCFGQTNKNALGTHATASTLWHDVTRTERAAVFTITLFRHASPLLLCPALTEGFIRQIQKITAIISTAVRHACPHHRVQYIHNTGRPATLHVELCMHTNPEICPQSVVDAGQ